MQRDNSNILRRLSYWALGIALLLLVVIATAQAIDMQLDLERDELERAQQNLEREAQIWDAAVAERAHAWLQELADTEDVGRREDRLREDWAWFEGFYLWRRGRSGPVWLHPQPTLVEDLPALNSAPCLVAAHVHESLTPPAEIPDLYRACRDSDIAAVRLFAATEAATRLLAMGNPTAAQQALQESRVPVLELGWAPTLGIASKRMAIRRCIDAEAVIMAGREQVARTMLADLGREIASQNGPVLEETIALLDFPVLSELSALGATEEVRELEAARERAQRRVSAWHEVRDALASRAEAGAELRVVHDQYEGHYLLVYSELEPGLFGAVQLDEPTLLGDLHGNANQREHLSVKSQYGDTLIGPMQAHQVEADFPEMLTHLRLGYGSTYLVDARSRYRTAFLSQILPVFVGALIGIGALFARVAADRRQQELLERQREFATRVTHELKTPLAGIRVMAENLELGSPDAATTTAFAHRIITEADKLTHRIDQILAVARTRAPIKPVEYRIDNLLETVIDEWSPRFTDAGMVLDSDLRLAGSIVGDPILTRDAIVCLLDNALKYRRADRPDGLVRVSLKQEAGQAVLSVSDNGIGVPENKRGVIFEPFARVEGPGRGKAGGHGLGLSFVLDAVQAQGGTVECGQGISGGARFTVRLPTVNRS